MAGDAFARPFLYWVGMDTDPRTTPEALAEFNRFYSETHVFEVMAAHPGFVGVNRYELAEDERTAGPRWLAVYEIADEAAAERYLADNARPWLHRRKYSPWPPARRRAKTMWRMLWRQTFQSGPAHTDPPVVRLLGTSDAPAVTASGEGRVTQWELYRAFAPETGAPRFCTIYEDAAPPEGQDDVVWRLDYRRIT